jgi:hypothetical protein
MAAASYSQLKTITMKMVDRYKKNYIRNRKAASNSLSILDIFMAG